MRKRTSWAEADDIYSLCVFDQRGKIDNLSIFTTGLELPELPRVRKARVTGAGYLLEHCCLLRP